MIENKLITIKKKNTFDKGWALFTPCQELQLKNTTYYSVNINDIVKQITYAKEITLFLAEECLHSKIIEEIKWVNNYADIHLIAKNNTIVNSYNEIYFKTIRIDSSLELNVINIKQKGIQTNYFIADGFQSTDDGIVKLLQSSKKNINLDMSALQNASNVIVLGESLSDYQDQIFDYCNNNNIKVYYANKFVDFNKSHYDKYLNSKVQLVVANHVGQGICIDKNNKLFFGTIVNEKFVFVEVENLYNYISGDIYINAKKKSLLVGEEIPDNVYVLYNGEISLLKRKDCHMVEKTVNIDLMADFIKERFDKSIVEQHNEYAVIAKNVEYQFTLIPPLYNNEFRYSDIYNLAFDLVKQWKDCYDIHIDEIKKEIKEFKENESFISMLNHIANTNKAVEKMIGEYDYKNYHSVLDNAQQNLVDDSKNILQYCINLNEAISNDLTDKQYSKIDEEIEGYKETIKEKEKDIRNNLNVLQNKRRIEILKNKIDGLIKIKDQFTKRRSSEMVNKQEAFVSWCKNVLNGEIPKVEANSVSTIVNCKELSKNEKLNNFLKKRLFAIKSTLLKLIDVICLMQKIDVPEEYVVFDYQGKHYITIDSEDEFYKTKYIQEKYNILCVARRK